ncbi:methyltransferase domain-containing protein [Thiohalobacter sp. IOR34]|uniref:class I SAM-dependent methyltransferase n=1 Tax=Thiohalobacter sp. IOR34 TaxID=3057176 RepID=UPI0025B20AEB|nr:class I SAM-dependent methyltransferase [Thiohalobacter sp. IOR34]WJW76025.1 methyltransferase domain-containing protein [Thiohalobacter sp. IOR34]
MWEERYSAEEYAYGTEPNDFLAAMAGRLPTGRCLCVAEGEGRNAVYLAGLGHRVTAVDSAAAGLAKARRLAAERGVEIDCRQADLADFPIQPDSWDSVVSIFCHLPPVLRADLHRRLVAGLRPGGMLLLEAYTPTQIALGTGGPPDAALTMTLDELRRELEGLEFLHAAELEREVIEGRYHTGRGAVVQLLARRP